MIDIDKQVYEIKRNNPLTLSSSQLLLQWGWHEVQDNFSNQTNLFDYLYKNTYESNNKTAGIWESTV